MTDRLGPYGIFEGCDPFEECRDWFWVTLGEDNVYSKDFLEYLEELVRQVEAGEIEVIPFEDVEALLEDLKDGNV